MTTLSRKLRLRALYQGSCRAFHSYNYPAPLQLFNYIEESILRASLAHVPVHGFTQKSLAIGAKDAGYLDASTTLFPNGSFSLVHYYLVAQRLQLAKHSQSPTCSEIAKSSSIAAKVKALTWKRLLSNQEIMHKWQEALALMALPANISVSLHELAALSNDIWFLSGDCSVDTSWYTKRASLSAIYASTELYMTTDESQNFINTEEFLHRRFEDSFKFGTALSKTSQWIGFTTRAGVNVLRSKGLGI